MPALPNGGNGGGEPTLISCSVVLRGCRTQLPDLAQAKVDGLG